VLTATYDHSIAVGFSTGFLVTAGVMLIALIVAIRVRRCDLGGGQW
jgi:hypothetical protein